MKPVGRKGADPAKKALARRLWLEGKTYRQIRALVGVSTGTIWKWFRKAKETR